MMVRIWIAVTFFPVTFFPVTFFRYFLSCYFLSRYFFFSPQPCVRPSSAITQVFMIRSERNLETKLLGIFGICRHQKIVNRWIIFEIMIKVIVFNKFTMKRVNVTNPFQTWYTYYFTTDTFWYWKSALYLLWFMSYGESNIATFVKIVKLPPLLSVLVQCF